MQNIDFRHIRPIRNSLNNGFEELCCQLARYESVPSGSRFVRNGTPDGGVEAYWQYPDGTERGWQAKYFFNLENTQWQQLGDSVKTALSTHPNLTHYTFCLPFDLPDARTAGRNSLRQKWEEHVTKWQTIARSKGMEVTFDLWGESALLDRLSREEHAGRRWFWFRTTELSQDWLQNHLAEAVAAAGPRYSQELNVELPIARCFDALGFTAAFRDTLARIRRKYRKRLDEAIATLNRVTASDQVGAARDAFNTAATSLLTSLSRFDDLVPSLGLVKDVEAAVSQARDATDEMISQLEKVTPPPSSSALEAEEQPSSRRALDDYIHQALDNFMEEIRSIYDTLYDSSAELADRPAMLLTGEAGRGKTHLLCDVAQRRIHAGFPTLLLMGQQLGQGNIWTQIVQRLGLQCGREELLGALETAAEAVGGRALIFLDAINEAAELEWETELPAMLEVVSRYPRIGIAVSCRSTYVRHLIRSDLVPSRLSRVEHSGFAGRLFEALREFCSYYGIETLNSPPLNPEFENPLFLKLYCQGLRNAGLRRPPKGHHGLQRIFSFLLDSANTKLQQPSELDYPEDEPIVERAVDSIADEMLKAGRNALVKGQARTLLESIHHRADAGYSKTLLRKLIDEGILVDDLDWTGGTDSPEHIIRFGYDRLADYLIAKRLLDLHLPGEVPGEEPASDGTLSRMFPGDHAYQLRGLLSAMIVLVPERTGREFDELIPSLQGTRDYSEAFLEALPWRDGKHITPRAVQFVQDLLASGDPHSPTYSDADAVMDRVLMLATQPDHPLNARWLHSRLLQLPMADRDLKWSTFLHRSWQARASQIPGAPKRLIDWAWPVNPYDDDPCTGFSNEVVMLALMTLTWCLTTSNRYVRDRATKALVCVLRNRLELIPSLLDDFEEVDDLYVTERLLCAIYGAVLHSNSQDQVGLVALAVYRHVFENASPPAHVLLRDYARGVVEYAISIGCSLEVDVDRIRPPYHSTPILTDIPSWQELRSRFSEQKYGILMLSLEPRFGDFARYVLGTESYGSGLHTWTDQPDPFVEYRRLKDAQPELPEPLASRWCEVRHSRWLTQLPGANSQSEVGSEDVVQPAPQSTVDRNEQLDDASSTPLHTESPDAFIESLSPEESQLLETYLDATEACKKEHEAACQIQLKQNLDFDFACRWIFTRVIDLGWTPERFVAFDSGLIQNDTRAAQKPERIGKKYQWIAYHELAARVLDHRPLHHDSMGETQHYEGPWQLNLRDIDPSCLFKNDEPVRTERARWWLPVNNPLLGCETLEDHEWLIDDKSIPDFSPLLSLQSPTDEALWHPLEASAAWNETEEAQERRGSTLRRLVTFSVGSFLLPRESADAFVEEVRSQQWGGLDVGSYDFTKQYLGELCWAPSFREFTADALHDLNEPADKDNSQIRCIPGSEIAVGNTVMRYSHSGHGFDCSLAESCSGYTPSAWLARRMRLSWGRHEFRFVGPNNELPAFDPSLGASSERVFLIDSNALQEFIASSGLAIVWLLVGEKLLLDDEVNRDDDDPRIRVFRQVYSLSEDHKPEVRARTIGYLGATPSAY